MEPITPDVLASLTEDDYRIRETAVRVDQAAHKLRGLVDGLLADRVTLRRRLELLNADQAHQAAGQTISGDLARIVAARDRLRDRVVDLATELAAEKAHAADTIKELAAERDTAQALAHRTSRDLRASLDREDSRPNLVELIHELRTIVHGRSCATGETPQEAWTATMADVRAVVDRVAELRSTAADLEEKLIAACGRETDRTAELDTALAALESLAVAAAQYTAAGKVSSGEELFAKSLLDVAHRGAVAVLRRHDDSPMVAISREHLSLLVGALTEQKRIQGVGYIPELEDAIQAAAALLQPARGTGRQQLAAAQLDGEVIA